MKLLVIHFFYIGLLLLSLRMIMFLQKINIYIILLSNHKFEFFLKLLYSFFFFIFGNYHLKLYLHHLHRHIDKFLNYKFYFHHFLNVYLNHLLIFKHHLVI